MASNERGGDRLPDQMPLLPRERVVRRSALNNPESSRSGKDGGGHITARLLEHGQRAGKADIVERQLDARLIVARELRFGRLATSEVECSPEAGGISRVERKTSVRS